MGQSIAVLVGNTRYLPPQRHISPPNMILELFEGLYA
jgi:hypothetical protein